MAAIRFSCIDSAAAPLFDLSGDGGRTRTGFEPEAAQLVADELGRTLEWVIVPWDEMIPAVQRGDADGVWCGQGIIPSRQEQVDFTRPYAVFNESVLVRSGDPARAPEDLRGYRVAAITGSANMRLAETFPDVELVPFASSDDVFADMIEAVRSGTVDAMVDDDVVTVPLGDQPEFDLAFTAETRNPWGVGVAKDRPEVLEEIDGALARVIADGRLEEVWKKWMPHLPFPAEALRGGTS
ncbi:ABC transporter substrate-binding protein [Brevibacterium daeguense]|uniref:ABC transporter substrate-binding protein n=1 Tax=Brevibacterium daeguense TaxID=909936 RepID=A0ABP8EJT3_9MICO|nr:ABC transporter substrate-binding protein [Brevibacterium daeguense]